MKLDRITLSGFKSFADRTTLKIKDSGVVAMVGPNGCGKSNIVDAFRWVMGESRASQLRQDTNADIIFNGAAGRRESDLCNVEINLINDGSKDLGMWGEYAEISIRREIERDGDSSYFINGQRVRRKDVVDVFAGTGTGARAYGIVEQERVTQMVRADPKRIREHLEEAAGVSQYKERRKETESRIGVSQANIARLGDKIAELQGQMKNLAKQAKVTETIRKQKKRLAAAKHLLLKMRHEELQQENAATEKAVEEAKETAGGSKERLGKIEKELEGVRKGRQEHSEKQNKLQGLHFETLADQEKARQALREHQNEVVSDESMLRESDQSVKELTEKLTEQEQASKTLALEIEEGAESIKKTRKDLDRTAMRLDEAVDKANEAKADLESARTEVSEAQRTEQGFASALSLAEHRVETLDESVASAKKDLAELDPVEMPDQRKLDELQELSSRAIDAAVSNERQRQGLSDEISVAKEELARLQGAKGGLQTEQDLLRRVSSKKTKFFEEWFAGHGAKGARLVIEEMDIKAPGIEKAVDVALSHYLQGYIVSGLDEMLEKGELPAGLVMLDKKAIGQQPGKTSSLGLDGIKPLVDCIKVAEKWQAVVNRWLDGVHLAKDLKTALGAKQKLSQHEMLVTAEGICLHDNVARVASDKEAGIEWHARLVDVEKGLSKIDGEIQIQTDKIKDLNLRHEELSKNGEKLAGERREAEESFDRLNQEAIRIGHAYEYRQEQVKRLNGVMEGAEKERKQRQDEYKKAKEKLKEAEVAAKLSNEALERSERAAVAANAKVADLREMQGNQNSAMHRLELTEQHNKQRLEETRDRIVEVQVALSSSRVKIVEIQARMRSRDSKKLEGDLKEATEKVAQAKAKLDEVTAGFSEIEENQQKLEGELANIRVEFEQAQSQQRDLEIEAAKRCVESDSIKSQIEAQKDRDEDAESLRKNYPGMDEMDSLVSRLEKRIESAGPVNYAAEAELAACETRLNEFTAQSNDLNEALDTLTKAIDRIDAEMLDRLKDVHSRLQKGFDAMFKRLFDGGEASVELVGDSLLSAGLALRAQPPGKRSSSIQALSGGEKTLTGIAFLFALNELNPPTFCILDEVDAALDEANTLRLCRLIEAMTDRMQFIMVTHNKLVIERADRLVGVTQHSKGVSSLVTVKVDQALEQAKLAAEGAQ